MMVFPKNNLILPGKAMIEITQQPQELQERVKKFTILHSNPSLYSRKVCQACRIFRSMGQKLFLHLPEISAYIEDFF